MQFSGSAFCKFFILTHFKILASNGYFSASHFITNFNVISSSSVVQRLKNTVPRKVVNASKYYAGFSLLECMVAQTILLIALTVIFQFLSQVKTQLYFISQDIQAQLLLTDLSERIKLFDVPFEHVASLSANNHQINNCQQNCSLNKNLADDIALWEQQLDTFTSATWEMQTQELAAQKLVSIKLSWKGYKDVPQQKILIYSARSKDDEI